MAKSLEQEQRDYALWVRSYEVEPPDTDYGLGYAQRMIDELTERGHTTLARKLSAVIGPYRREWLKTEGISNYD